MLLFLNSSLSPIKAYSQYWEGDKLIQTSNEWVFNVNVGFLSYFGDLSIYDSDISGKLESESGQAGGFMVTKRIVKPFGVTAQFISGNLKASKENISFKSTIFEYSIGAYIDLISLFKIKKLKNLEIQAVGGIGNLLFNSSKFESLEGETIRTDHKTRVPEFVFYAGAGIQYRFSKNFGAMSSIALRQCQNDKIDVYPKEPDFDYYSYLQFGLVYYFKPAVKTYVNNRARIAHNDGRLKALK